MEKMLELMEADATLTEKEIAMMLGKEEGDIKKMIEGCEREGIILAYDGMTVEI